MSPVEEAGECRQGELRPYYMWMLRSVLRKHELI